MNWLNDSKQTAFFRIAIFLLNYKIAYVYGPYLFFHSAFNAANKMKIDQANLQIKVSVWTGTTWLTAWY